jgi:hypothetical protein
MDDLDAIERHLNRLRERLVSALTLVVAAGVASIAIPELRAYFALVSLGAGGWVLIESVRLQFAAFDRESALNQLVLAGSRDPRCESRRADLRSAQFHHSLARTLRETCEQSHGATQGVGFVDRRAVRAVEADLRELAAVFDNDAGRLPPTAAALVDLLLSPRESPLFGVHPDSTSERHAVQTVQRIIARCRIELGDSEHGEHRSAEYQDTIGRID